MFLQKHTQYRGRLTRDDNVVGRHFWPGQAFLSAGLFFLTAAVMALIGGLVQINPIWAYGPFEPSIVSSPAQPDWYVGWLDGALRIFPPFEPMILGITIPSAFIPGIVVPGRCSRSSRCGRSSTAADTGTRASTTCWTGRGSRRPGCGRRRDPRAVSRS